MHLYVCYFWGRGEVTWEKHEYRLWKNIGIYGRPLTVIIIIIFPNIMRTLHPLVKSRIRTLRRAAPSQTEVTDLNCSDYSTT